MTVSEMDNELAQLSVHATCNGVSIRALAESMRELNNRLISLEHERDEPEAARWYERFNQVRCSEARLHMHIADLERENMELKAALAAIRNTTDQGKA